MFGTSEVGVDRMSISKIDLGGKIICLRMDSDTMYVDHGGVKELNFNKFINRFVEFIKDDEGLSETFLLLLYGHRSLLQDISSLQFETIKRILGYIKEVEDKEKLEQLAPGGKQN
jgi:hypothetical protein